MSTEANKAVASTGHGRTDASVNAAPQITTSRISQTMMGIAIAWFVVSAALGFSGFFTEHTRLIFLFVLTPVILFIGAFAVSRSVRAWAWAFDTRTLVMFQILRVGGIAFLAVYAVGKLNGEFALWAGLLDAATGFSALFAAHYLTPTRTAKQRGLLIAWMAAGILDFVVAIPLAAVVRASDPASMVALTFPPLSLITTYAVPLALMDYFVLGAQLWRQRRQA